MYKTVCAAFIWLPWDAHSYPYVCLYICYLWSSYPEAVSTLHCMLGNGADLDINECQKIRHYRARFTEERSRIRMPNDDFLLLAVRT